MARFLLFLLTITLVAASIGGAVDAATADEDDDQAQRQEAMAQVVGLARPSWRNPRPTDPETMRRLALFLKREMGPIEANFHAIRKMPEKSATDVRVKHEAFDAAMEQLRRHLRLLLPQGCAACATSGNHAGFALSNMTESSAAEFLSKEEARAAAKELLNRHLDGEAL